MNTSTKSAAQLHENVPPDWYFQSMKINLGQRYWHNRRFSTVIALSERVNGKILDIGCADGVFTNEIAKKTKAKKVIGIDVLKSSVDWAKKHWSKKKNLSFKVGNAHELTYPDNSFGAVYALEVLEHVPEPLKVLKEVKRVLAPQGYAIFLVPSDNKLFQGVWFLWTKFWRGRIWDDCHIQSYKDHSLGKLAKKAGLSVEVDDTFILGMLNVVKVRKV